jgi:hypothetical protein
MSQSLRGLILFLFFALMGSFSFCQLNPKYAAFVGFKGSGNVVRGEFLAQEGVAAKIKLTPNHWEGISVDSFTLFIQRDTAIIYQYRNMGNLFSDELKKQLKVIQPKDRILIFNIYARDVDNNTVFLSPLEYIIE